MNISTTNNSCDCNYIRETILKIDKMQKDILCDTRYTCISCANALFQSLYNTIPLSLYTCCGNPVTGMIGLDGSITTYFRVESVRCGQYATIRLLELVDGTLVGTDFTMIIDLDCIGRIQCFTPINVEVCTGSEASE